jgi:hypothetical protein
MTPIGIVVLILTILLMLLVCYVALLVVERVFGPIDATIKSIAGIIVLILILLYVLQHLGVLGWR